MCPQLWLHDLTVQEPVICCRLPNDTPQLAGDAVPSDKGGGEAQGGQDCLKYPSQQAPTVAA